jgi:hypothetical protein
MHAAPCLRLHNLISPRNSYVRHVCFLLKRVPRDHGQGLLIWRDERKCLLFESSPFSIANSHPLCTLAKRVPPVKQWQDRQELMVHG